jgi:hypothetical protein
LLRALRRQPAELLRGECVRRRRREELKRAERISIRGNNKHVVADARQVKAPRLRDCAPHRNGKGNGGAGLTGFARAYTGGEEGRRVEEVGGVQAAGDVEEGRRRQRRRRQRQGRRGHGLVPRRPGGRGRGAPQHVREARARERERSGPRVRRRLDAPGRRGGHRGRPNEGN